LYRKRWAIELFFKWIIGDKRKRKNSLQDVLNAVFYLVKAGCQ